MVSYLQWLLLKEMTFTASSVPTLAVKFEVILEVILEVNELGPMPATQNAKHNPLSIFLHNKMFMIIAVEASHTD